MISMPPPVPFTVLDAIVQLVTVADPPETEIPPPPKSAVFAAMVQLAIVALPPLLTAPPYRSDSLSVRVLESSARVPELAMPPSSVLPVMVQRLTERVPLLDT